MSSPAERRNSGFMPVQEADKAMDKENTELAKMYERNEYRCLGEDEYISLVINALKLIPPDVAIHRLTGDGDKRTLIAPEWTKNKKEVLNRMKKAIGDA